MIKTKKSIGLFSVIITFILLCTSVFVPFISKNQKRAVAESIGNSIYAFVSQQASQPGDTKLYVDFGLSLDYNIAGQAEGEVNLDDAKYMKEKQTAPFKYATVYIRTRNLSAVAEQGDYEAVDQTVILYGTDPYASLSIKVNKGGLQIGDSNTKEEGLLRSFIVEIYKVEVEGFKANEQGAYNLVPVNTTPNISSDTLSIEAELSLTSTIDYAGVDKDGNTYNLAYLDNIGHYIKILREIDLCEITENNNCSDVIVDLANIGDNMYAKMKYLSERNMLKLGIKIGGKGYETASGYVNNSYVGVQVFAGNSTKVGLPDLEDVPSNYIFSDPSVEEIARWYIKFQSDYDEDLSLSNSFNGSFEGVSVKTYFDEGIWTSQQLLGRNYGAGGYYDYYVKNGNENLVVIDDLASVLNGGSVISTRMWTYLSGTRKTAERQIEYLPINYRAEVSSATLGKVYYDANGKAKLGLSLRFSEPMQFRQYKGKVIKPSIDAYLNIATDDNKVTFDYLYGEGTDTFYFETELPEMPITSVKLENANGFDSIYDFAPYSMHAFGEFQNISILEKESEEKVNGWENVADSSLKCSFDLRKPKLALETKTSSEAKKSHPVMVRAENISETGKLYYGWSTAQGQIPEQLSVVSISPMGIQTIPSPSGISGTRYLYAFAVSELDKKSEALCSEIAFHFDNEAPILEEINVDNSYTEKKFSILVSNNSIIGFENYADLKNSVQVVVSSDRDRKNIILQRSVKIAPSSDSVLDTLEATFNFTLSAADDLKLGKDGAPEFATYYISFVFTDTLENRTVSEPTAYYFDIRNVFKAELMKESGDPDFEMEEFATDKSLMAEDYYTLDLSKLDLYASLYFKFKAVNPEGTDTDSDAPKAITNIGIEEFKNIATGYNAISDFAQETDNGIIKMTVVYKFAPGLYRLILKDLAADSSRQTLPIYFYVTNGKIGEDGTDSSLKHYQDVPYTPQNVALTNKVFQIPSDLPYYYFTDSLKTESYSGSNKPVSFSSRIAALSYIRYKECLDLYAIELDQTDANELNSGFLRKAGGVTQTAEAGQIWIRYKEVDWKPNTTTAKWVYYYYGADQSALPINVGALSEELDIALSTVTSLIGSYVKAVDLITEGFLDEYGSPMLSPEQIPAPASSLTSHGGTVFATAVEYSGDDNMYYSIEDNLPLVTNTLVGHKENSLLYYSIDNAKTYRPLTSGETFGECIQATGRVNILELSEKGVLEYYVFIDNEEPILSFTLETSAGTQTKSCSLGDAGATISGANAYIIGLTDCDALSFVAIYRYTSQGEGDLLRVYRKQDFDNGQGISLEDGKYHVQVSDRSGNSYIFVLQVRSDALVGTPTTVGSSYIRFEMNRDEEELEYYKVYLDGILLTTDYNDRRFTESGIYKFEIQDIYGKVQVLEYPFKRTLPTVDWRYKTDEGNYLVYDPENAQESEKLTVEKVNDQTYKLFTSTYLHFLPLEGCTYEIISGTPSPTQSITSKWVTLNQITSFTMKVYYEADPDVYVIYTCIVDNTAPIVSVSYEEAVYEAVELNEIQDKFKNGDFKDGKNHYAPSFIGFTYSSAVTFYVSNGERVQSKYFKVQISDDYGVKDVKIYLDDEWINPENTNFTYTYLSRRGTYKIVATDDYGNTSTFTFTNEYDECIEYFVDGEKISTDVAFADYFNGTEYTKVEYGNSEMEIKLFSSAEIHYIITDAEGNKKHFAFVVKDGAIYTFQYVIEVVKGEDGKPEMENISLRGNEPLKSGVVAEIKELDIAIYLSKNNDGSFSLSVRSVGTKDSLKEKTYTVETRISISEDESPYYFKTKISTIPSPIKFVGKEDVEPGALNYLKVSESFEINFDELGSDIETIEVAHSKSGSYTTYETIYTRDKGVVKDIQFIDDDGNPYVLMYYHIKVVNIYGIQTDYYVMLSSQFSITAKVEYADGTSLLYDEGYKKNDFYSNKSVEIIASSNDVEVAETSNKPISVTKMEQGYTVIYIDKPGDYALTITDEYGNVLTKYVSIKVNALTISEETLIGFNDKALRRDENYTNQEVFIKEQEIADKGIKFIGMRYQNVLADGTYDKEVLVTIYDQMSQSVIDFDAMKYVGALGNGKYMLIFRDQYGNKAETVIHYCATSTLTITRTTLNGVGAEKYSLEGIEENGVWTNDTVNFSVSATKYILTVDGLKNVSSISYAAKTKNEYEVYYLDEYGFEYTFKVYLHRKEVTLTPAESMSVSQLSDMLVTKDSVQMLFTENAYCSYILNNETEKVYNTGDVLYKDGIYRFKVIDKAGNGATYTVKKDSSVEYRLEGTGANEVLINGGITNGHSVKFYSEQSDSAYIKKVFHNNELIEYSDTMFNERGKWELIVADDAGNESYFRFYILYGKLDGFTYNTPYNYAITSVIWEMENSLAEATETIKEAGLRLEATENGTYTVTMQSSVTGDVQTFTFTIDKTPPRVSLIGCQENEKTINNVTLDGCVVGDTIYVYKDDKLIKTVRITSDYMEAPTMNEAGKYRILIENEAGVTKELFFELKYVPNVAGSVLIIVLALTTVVGLFVGLIWRNHSKTDD